MIAQYRKKPVIIEAEQFLCSDRIPRGVCMEPHLDGPWVKAHVHTMHGGQAVILELGDWIIPEPDGIHCYPCKPAVFEATYEPVLDSASAGRRNLRSEIEHAINCHSAENGSDTPDFILAEYLTNCLDAFDAATRSREKWYGREKVLCEAPSGATPPSAPVSDNTLPTRTSETP